VIHPETITVLYRRQNRAALLLALVVAAVRMLGAIDATPLTSVMQTLMDRAVAIPGFRMRKTLGDSASMLMAVSVSILFLAVGGRRQAVKVVTSVYLVSSPQKIPRNLLTLFTPETLLRLP
jgi:hypothetical protein